MSEWKEYKLGDIYEVHNGLSKGREFFGSGFPFISFSTVFNKWFIPEEIKDLAQTTEAEQENYSIKAGDILVTRTSETADELGMSCVALRDIPYATYNGFCKRMRQYNSNIEVYPKYVGYYLRNPEFRKNFQAFAGSMSTRASLTNEALLGLTIKLPPLAEQKRIAGILSSLDDKIELNNKINDNLEKQAQALFKNWFIDYAPFGSEELIDSPIEIKVPKSLKMIQVNDYPHIIETGRRPKGGAVGEGIPSIGAENVKELGVFDYSSNKFIPREFAETLGEKGKINGYELLLYKDGGKPGTFMPHFSMFGEGYPYEECYINEHVFKVDFGDKALNIFAYFYFQTEYVVGWLANNGGKAAIPGINQNDVNAVWIYNLNNPKVKEFGEIVKPMFEQILKNCKQNRELSIMRDALLPKLMMDKII